MQWATIPITVSLSGPDTAPPQLTPPPDITAEAVGNITTVNLGAPVVFDNSDPAPTVTNDSPGATESTGFPLGITTVTWTAADASGNSATAQQTVTVVDTAPPEIPQLLLPSDGTVLDSGVVTFGWSQAKDAVSTAITYDLLVSSSPDFSPPATIVIDQRGLTGLSYASPAATPLPDGTYYWKVRSSDGSGNASPYSAARAVVVDTVAPTVSASPPGGTYPSAAAQSVVLTASEPSATIYYTTDGSTPTTSNSTVYSAPFAVSSANNNTTTTLKFFDVDGSGNAGPVVTEVYVFDTVSPAVTAAPAGGAYPAAQSVVLTASEPATIYYTTDGSAPTVANSTVYTAPIQVSSNATLQFFAIDSAGNASPITSAAYVIDTVPPVVTASPAGGLYNVAMVSVALTPSEPSAMIYYTTDGSTPTTNSTVYTAPISLSSNTDLKFFAKDVVGNTGAVGSQTYFFDLQAPTVIASPTGGVFTSPQSVTLMASEPATIYYTTDGTDPALSGTVYSSPIAISAATTLKFFAKDTAGNSGAIGIEAYSINPVTLPATYMSDTTASFGQGMYSAAQQAHVEFVSPASQLIGRSIDEMTLQLRKTGAPVGLAEVGVFNPDLTVKKLFGTVNATAIATGYANYTFSLPGNDLYAIQSGDRIGIKYTGGNANNFIAVMLDRDATDPFDGANTYRQTYSSTSWLSSTSDDVYMMLRQTHG